jgi:hypothetical protein
LASDFDGSTVGVIYLGDLHRDNVAAQIAVIRSTLQFVARMVLPDAEHPLPQACSCRNPSFQPFQGNAGILLTFSRY